MSLANAPGSCPAPHSSSSLVHHDGLKAASAMVPCCLLSSVCAVAAVGGLCCRSLIGCSSVRMHVLCDTRRIVEQAEEKRANESEDGPID